MTITILATGASGQLARSLTALPRPADVRLIALGRPRLDIADMHSVHECLAEHAPDIVINTAAYTAVDKAEDERDTAFVINRDGARNVAEACAEHGIPLIHVSTDYVFDGTKDIPWVETDPTNPLNVYGASKLAGEQAVRTACPHHVIVRTSWVFSPWGHNFVRTMLRLARERDELAVVNDQHGCPTYAPHLAEALLEIAWQALQPSAAPWGTCHLSGSGEATWHDFAAYIMHCARQLGAAHAHIRPISTAEFPTRARRPANSRLDCSLAQRTFGIPLPHWREATEECVRHILEEEGTS